MCKAQHRLGIDVIVVNIRLIIQLEKSYNLVTINPPQSPSGKSLLICATRFECYFTPQATAEANNLTAVAAAKEVYEGLMEEVAGGTRSYLPPRMLEEEHRRAKDKALHAFHSKRKMGGQELENTYSTQLVKVFTLVSSMKGGKLMAPSINQHINIFTVFSRSTQCPF